MHIDLIKPILSYVFQDKKYFFTFKNAAIQETKLYTKNEKKNSFYILKLSIPKCKQFLIKIDFLIIYVWIFAQNYKKL